MTARATYSEIRPYLDTGDLVLFSGKGEISAVIKRFTRSPWSHVGMIVRLQELDLIALWESTTLGGLADLEAGRVCQGVQTVPFSDRLSKYPGTVALRRLLGERSPAMLEALRALRAALRGRPYERSVVELLRAAYDGRGGTNHGDLSSLFCSEMVAAAYQAMGLLPAEPAADEYVPGDFSSGGALGVGSATLPEGFSLGEEIVLVPG